MFYVEDILTDEIIDVFDNLDNAIDCCLKHNDSWVTDEQDNILYMSALPF
jgi:hypothetical protein